MRHTLRVIALTTALTTSLFGSSSFGQEAPPAPPTVAEAAAKARDATAGGLDVSGIANGHDPDPWLIVEHLLLAGDVDTATALAAARVGKEGERLSAYVLAHPAEEAAAAAETLGRIRELTDAGDPNAVAAVELPAELDESVSGLDALGKAYYAHRHLGAADAAGAILRRVSSGARTLGWTRMSCVTQHELTRHFLALRDARAAMQSATEAVELAREAGDRRLEVLGLQEHAGVWEAMGRFESALPLLQEALSLARELDDVAEVGIALRRLGGAQIDAGRVPDAIENLDEAVVLLREAGDLKGLSRALNDSAIALETAARWDEAAKRYFEARGYFEQLGDRGGYANTLNNLGLALQRTGRLREAIDDFKEARRIFSELGYRDREGNALGNLGLLYARLGNFEDARRCLRETLEMRHEQNDPFATAMALNHLGFIELQASRLADALRYWEAALTQFEKLEAHLRRAGLQLRLSRVYAAAGNHERAIELCEQAIAKMTEVGNLRAAASVKRELVWAEIGAGRHEDALAHLVELRAYWESIGMRGLCGSADTARAELLARMGRDDESLAAARSAIALLSDAPEAKADGTAMAWIVVGRHLAIRGDVEEARAAYETAANLTADAPNSRHAMAITGLARLDLSAGDAASAFERADRALTYLLSRATGLSDTESAGLTDQIHDFSTTALAAAVALDDPALVSRTFERVAAVALRDRLGARDALESVVLPPELLQELALARHEEEEAAKALRAAEAAKKLKAIRTARTAHEEAQARTTTLVTRVEREANAAAALTSNAVDDLATIQARLDANERLVCYVDAGDRLAALVIGPDAARIVSLCDTESLDAALAGCLLDDDPHIDPAGAAVVAGLVAAPLSLEQGVTRVLVVPTGRLAYVPPTLLFPERDIAFVPSGTVHGLLHRDRDLRGTGVLALGDPDYRGITETVAAHRGVDRRRLAPLPGTRSEVTAIGSTVLLGSDATETRLRTELAKSERWRSVHLACHGLIDTENPLLSSLALTPDAEDDGFLSCLDLFGLEAPADVVVLSACETGKGRIHRSEGVLGLTRAFMYAGTPRVVCSLWNVDDAATQALMKKLYELWNPEEGSGLPLATALRQAQEHVRSNETWSHPKYWAAWVIWGLPR